MRIRLCTIALLTVLGYASLFLGLCRANSAYFMLLFPCGVFATTARVYTRRAEWGWLTLHVVGLFIQQLAVLALQATGGWQWVAVGALAVAMQIACASMVLRQVAAKRMRVVTDEPEVTS